MFHVKHLKIYLISLCFLLLGSALNAHCQIPCGIYDDNARITLLFEHAKTIRKSVNKINSIEDSKNPNNQLTRWVMNKEKHATEIQEIMNSYFLAQRIKLPKKDDKKSLKHYQKLLASSHKIIVAAMKTKQTSNLNTVDFLTSSIEAFKAVYNHK